MFEARFGWVWSIYIKVKRGRFAFIAKETILLQYTPDMAMIRIVPAYQLQHNA